MTLRRLTAAVGAALLVGLAACSPANPTIRGVVVDVQGDLAGIDRFTVLGEDGARVDLEPAPEVRFHGGAPLSHLNEHLRTGHPIEVVYQVLDDGQNVALEIEDVSNEP